MHLRKNHIHFKITYLFLIIQLVIACSSDQNSFSIKEGQGVDGIEINISNISNITDKYGKEINYNQGIIDYSNGSSVYINRFYYSNKIVVISITKEGNKENNKIVKSIISEIGILYPADALTDKGINLKFDKYEKIIKIYGLPENQETSINKINLHYYSKGISFCCNNLDYHIEKIAIYKKGNQPDFYY